MNSLRTCALVGFAALIAAPVMAQDTLAPRTVGLTVDFQDADLRVVITALAESAGLNVAFADLPLKRVTLRLRQPVPRSEVRELLKSLASTYDLVVTDDGRLLRFASSASPSAAQRPALGQAAGDQQLFIYRLRHVRAAILAPTLQSMFLSRGGTAPQPPGIGQVPLSQRIRTGLVPPVGDSAPRSPPSQGSMGVSGQVRGDIQIMPDESSNALIVRAVPSDWAVVRQAIEAMDLRPLEALIEVVIAEVRESKDLELGVSVLAENPTDGGKLQGGIASSSAGDFVAQLTRSAGGFTLDAAISALASRGRVRIVSRPILLAQNNKEARILVGSQRPFVQVSRSLPTDAGVRDQVVQYREVGTSLSIVPTINADGYVNLQVLQEVSSATAETQFGAPVISTREASTQLLVKSGQTGVIGGLVDRQEEHVRSGVPFLSSIPVLGALFGSTARRASTSELFLFLTPHVITRDDDVDALRESIRRAGGPGGAFGEVDLQRIVPPSLKKP